MGQRRRELGPQTISPERLLLEYNDRRIMPSMPHGDACEWLSTILSRKTGSKSKKSEAPVVGQPRVIPVSSSRACKSTNALGPTSHADFGRPLYQSRRSVGPNHWRETL